MRLVMEGWGWGGGTLMGALFGLSDGRPLRVALEAKIQASEHPLAVGCLMAFRCSVNLRD